MRNIGTQLAIAATLVGAVAAPSAAAATPSAASSAMTVDSSGMLYFGGVDADASLAATYGLGSAEQAALAASNCCFNNHCQCQPHKA